MGEVIHNKLVRDGVPDIIRRDNAEPYTRTLDDDELYKQELLRKLVEEATELLESGGSLEERADVAEVLREIDRSLFDDQSVEVARVRKLRERGGFKNRTFLEKVIEGTDSE